MPADEKSRLPSRDVGRVLPSTVLKGRSFRSWASIRIPLRVPRPVAMVLLSMCLGAILCVGLGIAGWARYLMIANSPKWQLRWLFGSGHLVDIGERSSLLINNRLLFSVYEADHLGVNRLPPLPAPHIHPDGVQYTFFKAPAWSWQRPHPRIVHNVQVVENLAVGSPFRCFVGTMERRYGSNGGNVIHRGHHWIINIAQVPNHAAPTHILPGSLVVNWLFWTSIVFAGLHLPRAYRAGWAAHRRRRGRCICGYHLLGLTPGTHACPECGAVIPAATSA